MVHDPHRDASAKYEAVLSLPALCADELKAVEFFEQVRWGDEPACPKCGDTNVYKMTNRDGTKRNEFFRWRCRGCKKQYTVKVGTVMEQSAIPHCTWLYAWWLFSTSKKGISALQLRRMTGITYKSAWFLLHRIRAALELDDSARGLLGGPGKEVEIDETYVGGKPRPGDGRVHKRGRGTTKTAVLGMVERGGEARYEILSGGRAVDFASHILNNVDSASRLITDQLRTYIPVGRNFKGGHGRVKHPDRKKRGWYVHPDDPTCHTNTVEGLFSLLKRAIIGTFHFVSRQHLKHYLVEFAFKYNTRSMSDADRLRAAFRRSDGKRMELATLRGLNG